MTSSYVRVTGPADLFAAARELSVKTMIFDVKPLVAPWHSSQDSLDQGIARILGDEAGTRRPSACSGRGGSRLEGGCHTQ